MTSIKNNIAGDTGHLLRFLVCTGMVKEFFSLWKNGSDYNTSDNVFIPSTTELGDTDHNRTYPISTAYAYFQGTGDAKRVALLGGETWLYWTCSPDSALGRLVRGVSSADGFLYLRAYNDGYGVRPALNLKSEILVSEIRN